MGQPAGRAPPKGTDTVKSIILVGEIPYIGNRILTGWRQETDSRGSSKPPTAPHCPAGVFLVIIGTNEPILIIVDTVKD